MAECDERAADVDQSGSSFAQRAEELLRVLNARSQTAAGSEVRKELETEIESLTTQKKKLETEIKELETEIVSLTTQKKKLETEIVSLTIKKKEVETDIESLNVQITKCLMRIERRYNSVVLWWGRHRLWKGTYQVRKRLLRLAPTMCDSSSTDPLEWSSSIAEHVANQSDDDPIASW